MTELTLLERAELRAQDLSDLANDVEADPGAVEQINIPGSFRDVADLLRKMVAEVHRLGRKE